MYDLKPKKHDTESGLDYQTVYAMNIKRHSKKLIGILAVLDDNMNLYDEKDYCLFDLENGHLYTFDSEDIISVEKWEGTITQG